MVWVFPLSLFRPKREHWVLQKCQETSSRVRKMASNAWSRTTKDHHFVKYPKTGSTSRGASRLRTCSPLRGEEALLQKPRDRPLGIVPRCDAAAATDGTARRRLCFFSSWCLSPVLNKKKCSRTWNPTEKDVFCACSPQAVNLNCEISMKVNQNASPSVAFGKLYRECSVGVQNAALDVCNWQHLVVDHGFPWASSLEQLELSRWFQNLKFRRWSRSCGWGGLEIRRTVELRKTNQYKYRNNVIITLTPYVQPGCPLRITK